MSDYLIIGGGLLGQFTARYLNEAGAQVTILERGSFGQESSWAGGGILSPLYPWRYPRSLNELVKWSQEHYPELVSDLQQSTGIDTEWTKSGLLILDNDQTPDAQSWAESMGVMLLPVTGAEIREIEPAVGEHAQSGLWMPDVAQIRNPRLLKALKQDLILRGVRLMQDIDVTELIVKDNQIHGVRTSNGDINSKHVVIACGAWSAILLKELGQEIPVVPVRGQMILLRAKPGQLQRIVLHKGHYAIPRRDGRILVGSTLEKVGFDKSITEQGRNGLIAAARDLIPKLENAPVEKHWAGLRPGSPNGVPFIGVHPKVTGLYINAGHYRNGVVTAPASAKLLADMLLGRPEIIKSTPYALNTGSSDALTV